MLNYLKAKLKLLVKHILTPIYSNWDLELKFEVGEWTVTLVGFLHCEEFNELNQKIARGELSPRETARAILRHPQVLPTVALTANRLEEEHGFSPERAQVILYIVHMHPRNIFLLGIRPFYFNLARIRMLKLLTFAGHRETGLQAPGERQSAATLLH